MLKYFTFFPISQFFPFEKNLKLLYCIINRSQFTSYSKQEVSMKISLKSALSVFAVTAFVFAIHTDSAAQTPAGIQGLAAKPPVTIRQQSKTLAAAVSNAANTGKQIKDFQTTTKYLDQNGLVFYYSHYGTAIQCLEGFVNGILKPAAENDPQMATISNIVSSCFNTFCIRDIGGYGCSVQQYGDTYCIKSMSQICSKNSFATKLIKNAPAGYPLLDLAPANTSLAFALNFDGKVFQDAVLKVAADSNDPSITSGVDMLKNMGEASGIDYLKILPSVTSAGFFMTGIPENMDTMPNFIILLTVKDDSIFNAVQQNYYAENEMEPDPALNIQPNKISYVNDNTTYFLEKAPGMLLFTNTSVSIAALKAAKKLKDTPDFASVSTKNIPNNGNAWLYVAPQIGKKITQFISDAASSKVDISASMQMLNLASPLFVVSSVNDDGFYCVGNVKSLPLALLIANPSTSALVPTSVLLPVIGSMRERASSLEKLK